MPPATRLRVQRAPIATLKAHPRNARQGDVGAIAASLEAHGQYRPIVVQESTRHVLAGNHTLAAARALGWSHVEIVTIDVDDDEALRILLVDNKASDDATYSDAALAALLEELAATGAGLAGTGFDGDDLDELLARLADQEPPVDLEGDPDELPPAPARIVKPGDVWQVGEHRLVCGDAADPATYAALLGDEAADLVWTDPPYNVAYEGGAGTIANDDLEDQAFADLLAGAFGAMSEAMKPGAVIYVAHADTARLTFTEQFIRAGFKLSQVLIWVKSSATFGRADFNWRHEPMLYGWKPGAAHYFVGDFTQTTVVDDDLNLKKATRQQLVDEIARLRAAALDTVLYHDKPTRSDLHPTMKPVALVGQMIAWSSHAGQIVLDPFAGSGSTMVAAHQHRRRARLIELEPAYCDVILARMESLTGLTPVNAGTGKARHFTK